MTKVAAKPAQAARAGAQGRAPATPRPTSSSQPGAATEREAPGGQGIRDTEPRSHAPSERGTTTYPEGIRAAMAGRQAKAGVYDARIHCGTKTHQTSTPCRQRKGFRTDHPGFGRCWLHGGRAPNGKKQAAREKATARLTALGVPVTTDWRAALREQIAEANGNVAFLRQEAQALGSDLVGEVMSDARDGTLYATKEEARAIVRLYNEERDRLVKFCKVAAEVGFAEAEIELAKQQGQLMAAIVFEVLDGLKLPAGKITEARQLLGAAFRRHSPSLATAELS